MFHMAEYTRCSSVAFERPNEYTFTLTPHPLRPLPRPRHNLIVRAPSPQELQAQVKAAETKAARAEEGLTAANNVGDDRVSLPLFVTIR